MEEKTKALSVRGNIEQKDVDGEPTAGAAGADLAIFANHG